MKKLRFQFNFYLMKIEMWWSDLLDDKREEKAEIKESLSNRRKKVDALCGEIIYRITSKKPSMIGKKNL